MLPIIELVAGTVLPGSTERFCNLTFAEFIYTKILYTRLAKKLDKEAPARFTVVLYRPQRQDYNPTSPSYKGDILADITLVAGPNRAYC